MPGGTATPWTAPAPATSPASTSSTPPDELGTRVARGLKRDTIAHLGTLDFAVAKENVVFLGHQAPARPTWRSALGSAPARPATGWRSPPPPNGSTCSPTPTPPAACKPSWPAWAAIHCWSSTYADAGTMPTSGWWLAATAWSGRAPWAVAGCGDRHSYTPLDRDASACRSRVLREGGGRCRGRGGSLAGSARSWMATGRGCLGWAIRPTRRGTS